MDGQPLPHHPTYGVSIKHSTIRAIVEGCVPGEQGEVAIEELSNGASFNNKLYFIHTTNTQPSSYVLKVNGRFFGPDKIENEVGCLALLQEYCPAIPAPTVVAWSPDGSKVFRFDGNGRRSASSLVLQDEVSGWVLMTKLPGESMVPSTLSVYESRHLAEQLADILLRWRKEMPPPNAAGNVSHTAVSEEARTSLSSVSNQITLIESNLGFGRPSRGAVSTLLEYYRAELDWQTEVLRTNLVFAGTRAGLLPLLEDFINAGLRKLSLFDNDEHSRSFVFTSNDLAPRNILISGNPPIITGIVDFEFSGFFPAMEEFEQEWAEEDEDEDEKTWPTDMYESFLARLEEGGARTPLSIRGTRRWREVGCLYRLRNCIAPWWLVQGGGEAAADGDAVKASSDVKAVLAEINQMIGDGCRE